MPTEALEIRRTFEATRERVFAAFADRAQLEQWMCKDAPAHEVIHHVQDIRSGGRYLIEVRDKGETYWGQGVYRDVTPPSSISFTWCWTKGSPDGINMHPGSEETLVTVEFVARGNSTEVVLTHSGFATDAIRKDHERGWNGCFDVLSTLLYPSRESLG